MTARRTPGGDTPEPLGIDLDALEYDGPAGPFPFKHNGHRYVLASAADLDVNTLNDMSRDPMLFLAQALDPADYEKLTAQKLPLFKLQKLLAGYVEHYDLGNSAASVG